MNKQFNTIRFAVEIEVEFPQAKDSYDLIQKNRLIRGWEMDFDGSLDNGAEYRPKDNNKLYYNEDCIDQIKEIIGLIKAHKGNIRPTCGLHIHIDMKKFTNKEILAIAKNFVEHQDKIYKDFKVLKSRQNFTAKKLPRKLIQNLDVNTIKNLRRRKTSWYESSHFDDRYFGLNLDSLRVHKTIEFRFFNGTIQPRNIKSNIKWCIEYCLTNCKVKHDNKANKA